MDLVPLISIIIPSYNQAQWLSDSLDSILNQQDQNIELILIDGDSNDGSKDVIKKYADRLVYWESQSDRGQSHALNKGFAKAKGEWLGWLNSDDLLLPDALKTIRNAIKEIPEASWFAGSGSFIDEQGNKIKNYSVPKKPLRAEQLSPWTHNWFAQPGCFFKRSLFEQVGSYLREDLHYAMDLDLWLRMGQHSSLYPIDKPLGAYRLHNNSKTIAERPEMEVEVVQVLAENLGLESALDRVKGLTRDKFEVEFRYQRLTNELRSPLGWLKIIKRQLII